MKAFFKEFRDFIMRGNVMNLAVGVLIGAAFQAVVSSLSDNILSPIIGIFAGQNFDSLSVTFLGVTLQYGAFITALINFLITAFVIFLIVKGMNKVMSLGEKKKDAPAAPTHRTCPYCCTEISISASRCPACTSELERAE